MGSFQRVLVYVMTTLTGVAVAFGFASLVGLVWHAAKLPIFLVLSVWWIWIGWRYACARDSARQRQITGNEALSRFHQRYPREIISYVRLADIPPRGYYQPDPIEDCWFMQFSLHTDQPGLHSSRLVAVSKRDGRIIYDGSANDEG